jgi:hypothetical protein
MHICGLSLYMCSPLPPARPAPLRSALRTASCAVKNSVSADMCSEFVEFVL